MTRFSEQGAVDPDEVHRHLREKGIIAAIKYYRHQTGAGLKEAKEAVEALEAQQIGLPVAQSTDYQQGIIDPAELHRILRAQGKIPAIKYYREQTGVGLKEAKEAVESLEAQQGEFHVAQPTEHRQGMVDPDELRRLLRTQGMIPAIKYYRQATGVGLKEAKDAVEYIAKQNRF